MKRQTQKQYISTINDAITGDLPLEFGGILNKGKRKTKRPLTNRHSLHVVLKATTSDVLLLNRDKIDAVISQMGSKFGIKVYSYGIHADHIHLHIHPCETNIYTKWIRALSSTLVTGIPELKWKLPPYTRIVHSEEYFQNLPKYILKNQRQGEFFVEAHERMAEWKKAFLNEKWVDIVVLDSK
jgi:hypothetical protein